MEETKEQQSAYRAFRSFIYISIILEFYVYAIPEAMFASIANIFVVFQQKLSMLKLFRDLRITA